MRLTAQATELQLKRMAVSGRDSRKSASVIQVELHYRNTTGFGEGAPLGHYEETPEAALCFLEDAKSLLGDDPFKLETIAARLASRPGPHAAKAAIDAALHDLCGKLIGQPVWRMLGVARAGPPTCWTIWLSDPDDMADQAAQAVGRFKHLKLKLGGRDGLDADRVRAVRQVTDLPLAVDPNESWSFEEALDTFPVLATFGVEYCEQPLPARDPQAPELRRLSPLPIVADEDCHTLRDIAVCAERAHGINIKLSKSGGIREALRMVHAARALGLRVMIGCQVESGLGIAAACQIASLCDHVDLDGNLLLTHDPWPGIKLINGVQLPTTTPGLGVRRAAQ